MNLKYLIYIIILKYAFLKIKNIGGIITYNNEILLNINLYDENNIYELIKFENNNYLPEYIKVEFIWNIFKINDIKKEYCYYYNNKFTNLHLNEEINICKNKNLYEIFLIKNELEIKNLFKKINNNLLEFYDLEYNPSRPVDVSDKELNIWRINYYNRTNIEKLIIPGNGSNRIYARINTSTLTGNYFGNLKITFKDKTFNIEKIKLNIELEPINIGINNKLIHNDKVIVDIELKNNLVFSKIYSKFFIIKNNKERCLIIKENNNYGFIILKPGQLEHLKVICLIDQIKDFDIKSELNWSNNRKYSLKINKLTKFKQIKRWNRGIILNEYIDKSILKNEYNFISNIYEQKITYFSNNKDNTLNLNIDYYKNNLIKKFVFLRIDLLEISSKILNLDNVNLMVKILNKKYSYLNINFVNNNDELIYEFDTFTIENSLIYLKIKIEYFEKNVLNYIFKHKANLSNYIGIPIKVVLNSKDKNINNYINEDKDNNDHNLKKLNIFEKIFMFKFKININNLLFIGNVYNYDNTNKLIIDDYMKDINLTIFNANNHSKNINIDFYISNGTNMGKNNLIFLSNILSKNIDRYHELVFNFNPIKYINKEELISKYLISINNGKSQDLPYFIKFQEAKLQLSILPNCGEIKLINDEIDFGIIPTNFSKDLYYKKTIKLILRRNLDVCRDKSIILGLTISKYFTLKILDIKPFMIISEKILNKYIYKLNIDINKVYDIIIEPNFNQSIVVENENIVNLSTNLNIYTEEIITIKENDISRLNLISADYFNLEVNETFSKKLVLLKNIKIKCLIRSLKIKIRSKKLINPLQSELIKTEIFEKKKLPVSLMLIELKNEEKFPIQYSIQYDVNKYNVSTTFDYIMENYALYIKYDNNIELTENLDFIQNNSLELMEDELLFNFPFKGIYYNKINLDKEAGILRIYNKKNIDNLLIRIIPTNCKKKIEKIGFVIDYFRINIFRVTIKLKIKLESTFNIFINLLIYETGRIDWYLYINKKLKNMEYIFLDLIPYFSTEIENELKLNLINLIDVYKINQSIKISLVPWIEISNDTPRVGYLLPDESRKIPILIHNQLITSSSVNSKLKEINCNYNLIFKGISNDNYLLNSENNMQELFSRKLIENDAELRNENDGMRTNFLVNWKVPNILNDAGIGGGFVKKIVLMNSLSNLNKKYLDDKSIIFVIEIQNPIICTKKKNEIQEFDNLINDDDENDQLKNRLCEPFNNIELVKGFRVIWYPYNNFNPTNYKSIEFLLKYIPKYNFKTSSYSYETLENTENNEDLMVNHIFQEYLKENNSPESDFAYLIKFDCNCILNQQYSFKFAVTHYENVQNSVYVPPFGFNVTIQDHSLRWLKSLKNLNKEIDQEIINNITSKICSGKIQILSNNTAILYWNKEDLEKIDILTFNYTFNKKSDIFDKEWKLSEYIQDNNFENQNLYNLKKFNSKDSLELNKGILTFFNKKNNFEYFIVAKNIPSNTNIKFIIEIGNKNEKFQCISKSFKTFQGVPMEPLNFRYFPLTSNSIKMMWDEPLTNGGSNIIDYKITLIPELVNNTSKYYFNIIEKIVNKTFVVIDNIPHIITFKSKIQARNKFGIGNASILEGVSSLNNIICKNIDLYKLIINEFSENELVWKINPEYIKILDELYIYVYCNREKEQKKNLISLIQSIEICKPIFNDIICNWIVNDELNKFKCKNYNIKIIQKNNQNNSEICVLELNEIKLRKLNFLQQKNYNSLVQKVDIRHLKSLDEINEMKADENFIYPEYYNPYWNNGLIKSILDLTLLNFNTSFVELEINYLYLPNHFDDVSFNGTMENTWSGKYSYNLKKNYQSNLKNTNSWSFEKEKLSFTNEKINIRKVKLMILNLIPDTTISLKIKELDLSKNKNSVSNHILKIPKINNTNIENNLFLNSNFLQLDFLYSSDQKFNIRSKLQSEKSFKIRYLKDENSKIEYIKFKINTNFDSFNRHMSNSLFISGKMYIEGWPNDFEKRLFQDLRVSINSGHLLFDHEQNYISGVIKNYKPISEIKYYNQSFFKNNISNLFDGNFKTSLNFYTNKKSNFQELINNKNSYFPHINIKLDQPICILYIKLHWKAIYSPLSTVVNISIKSRNNSKPRFRAFNPTLHKCNFNQFDKFDQERIDTIPIIPPEEMVNTYFTNPINRYPSIYNITLSFIGSCINKNLEDIMLSLNEIELVPCITNDLVLSYSDPLSHKNNSLINNDYYIEKSQIEKKISIVKQIIISNLKDEFEKNLEDGYQIIENEQLKNMISKYEIPVNKNRIYLDIKTILSEEEYIRSNQIPSVRLLIQNKNESKLEILHIRNLNQKDLYPNHSKKLNFIWKLWIELIIILKWNYIKIKRIY